MVDEFFIVVTLGDSLTLGYRMSDPFAMDPRVPYPSQLEALLRKKIKSRKHVFVINAGVNGEDTESMLRRFGRVVAPEKPELARINHRKRSWTT
jgi:lysophospholipase L1-like esterase